jgi:pilus assembly protein CpaC
VLGALFHSDKFQRDETELVIVVTPYIVRPTGDPKALHVPDAATAEPASDVQRILLFRQFAGASASPPPPVPGDVGFLIR